MILIFSNVGDQSTTEVIDWCIYFQKKYFLITDLMLVTEMDIIVDHEYAILTFDNGKILDTRQITAFWYRRQTLHFVLDFSENLKNKLVATHLKSEWKVLSDYLFSLFQKKGRCSNYFVSDVNKLMVLEIARKLGIRTPKTIVSSRSSIISEFLPSQFINKTVHNILAYSNPDGLYMNRTVSKENIEFPEEPFFPSLFQSEIVKKYEVRTFFLKDKFSSMAIFSQDDPQTRSDFRMYNYEYPNRNVPYNLPIREKEQMIELMQLLKLESGSIDFIVDSSEELIFLEVNPVGQFGMVSSINNDPLEMYICQELINS